MRHVMCCELSSVANGDGWAVSVAGVIRRRK